MDRFTTTRSRAATLATIRPAPGLGLTGALLLGAALALVPVVSYAQSATPTEAIPPGPTTTVVPAPAEAPVAEVAPGTQTPAAETPQRQRAATAQVKSAEGAEMGTVTLTETASGKMQVTIDLTGVPEGVRAVHIHETGQCDAPSFESAGGHLADGMDHGAHVPGGMHPGDLPNLTVGADGIAQADVFSTGLTMDLVMDGDGSAFVIHDGTDDYASQPSGNAGDRIACGVFNEEAAAN